MQFTRFAVYLGCLLAFVCPSLSFSADVVFNEQFNDNQNRWPIADSKNYYTGIRNGKYLVKHRDRSLDIFYGKTSFIPKQGDFAIEGVIKKNSGGGGNVFGITFGYDSRSKSGHFFHLSGSGKSGVHVLKNGKWQRPLVSGQLSKVMQTGNKTNRLAVVFQDNETHFLLNNIFIGSVPRIRLFGDRLGLSIKGDVVMEVESLVVFSGVPDVMGNKIMAAKFYQDPGIMFHDMKILPYEVKAGALFDFKVDFTVTDSKREGKQLPVVLSYSILEKGKNLFKKSVELSVDANESFSFLKQALIAATKKGKYTLYISINYNGLDYAISQEFTII